MPSGMSASLIPNHSQMGALVRSFDWASTPLGAMDTWSPTLLATVRLVLSNSFPMLLWWGPEFIQIYNDAYIPVLGDKHPHRSLGKRFQDCWGEVFDVLGPLALAPFQGGPATHIADIPLEVNRFDFVEETHFTIGYSAVPDPIADRGIGGVLATVHEITGRVAAERRVLTIRDLGTGLHAGKTADDACSIAASTLAQNPRDLPFTLIYLIDADAKGVTLAAKSGVAPDDVIAPAYISLEESARQPWPIAATEISGKTVLVPNLRERFERVPAGPWSDPPNSAVVLPIRSSIAGQWTGFFVAGLSPRLRFDDSYRGFIELVAAQIGTAVSNARAFEDERRRREALAEIDRAKTVFFTNVSHEFRTPLTLMMGSVEEALAYQPLPAQLSDPLNVAHRSSLRLLKLVNTLLDFARIESGRVLASYECSDLCAVTEDLASVFRSTMERSGLDFEVRCEPLPEPVYLDREMWEKVVHNLISNAFKFTLKGSVSVLVRNTGEAAELVVRDTGNGISPEDLPHIFERFYRARHSGGRSYEGSGIGLALVQELVKLHGGAIHFTSQPGVGTTATVTIPYGRKHLAAERVENTPAASTRLSSSAFVQEMEGWLQDRDLVEPPKASVGRSTARIVLADDNADMREYVRRLLAAHYAVEAVSDGEAALAAAHRQAPDMVLSDIMMPRLDGFGLLKALRSTPALASTPIILLSARAGEEARLEGLAAGADDYLVKPFAARELLARIENQLALSKVRRESEMAIRTREERLHAFVTASTDAVYRMSPDWSVMHQLHGRDFISDTAEPDDTWLEKYILPEDRPRVLAAIAAAVRNRDMFSLEHRVIRADGSHGWTFSRAVPILDKDQNIVEWFGAASDITSRKTAEQALLRSEKLVSVGRMASSIAHEINNPLESVTNLIYLARLTPSLPDEARRHLELAEGELNRIAHITRQSLGFYRESNAPGLVSVVQIINSAIDLLANKIRMRHAKVQKEYLADEPVLAVAGELRQVFSNLLANSLDALTEGGTIHVRVAAYRSSTHNAQRRIRVTFADNGSGISRESKAHLFEPLFTTKGTVGTGLGLWVSRQLIERHGGTIQVRSTRGTAHSGAVFSVTLPVATPEAKVE